MTKVHLDHAHNLHLLKEMIRIRRFEEKCVELYQAQKIRGFLHLYDGEEAVSVGLMQALAPADAVIATYREHGQAIARGVPMTALMAEMYGRLEGCCRGRVCSAEVPMPYAAHLEQAALPQPAAIAAAARSLVRPA